MRGGPRQTLLCHRISPPPFQNNFLHVDKWRAAWCCQSSMAQQTPVTRQRWWHGVARGRHECGKEPPTDAGGWHAPTPITSRSMVGCDGSYPSTQLCPQRLGQLPWSVFCPKAIQILAPLFVSCLMHCCQRPTLSVQHSCRKQIGWSRQIFRQGHV